MENFKKGDFVKVNDKEIGIVAGEIVIVEGECGNLLRIRLNNMAEIICNPRLDGQKVEKIKGAFVPVNLDDAEVRKNLRGAWCTVKNNFGIYETPINGFGKVGNSGKWKAIFQWQISDGGWGADSDELYENVKIEDLPVRAVEER